MILFLIIILIIMITIILLPVIFKGSFTHQREKAILDLAVIKQGEFVPGDVVIIRSNICTDKSFGVFYNLDAEQDLYRNDYVIIHLDFAQTIKVGAYEMFITKENLKAPIVLTLEDNKEGFLSYILRYNSHLTPILRSYYFDYKKLNRTPLKCLYIKLMRK